MATVRNQPAATCSQWNYFAPKGTLGKLNNKILNLSGTPVAPASKLRQFSNLPKPTMGIFVILAPGVPTDVRRN